MNVPRQLSSEGWGGAVENGLGLLARGLGAARAAASAAAGDLLRARPDDPLDEWDPDFIRSTLPTFRFVTGLYFRPEVRGLERIPAEGPVLLVGNHSGGLLIADTFVFAFAFYSHFGPERRFHQLAHDVAITLPGLAPLRRYGTISASHRNGERALDADAALLVYPGGDYESFRPSWHSSEVQFGGRSGFVRLALARDVPIVPVVAIGGQETALFLSRGRRLARLLQLHRLRIKVLPLALAPPFGLTLFDLPGRIPLPSQITIQVLPPVEVRERFGPEPDEEEVYREVTHTMQRALDELAEERDLPVVGAVRRRGRGPERDGEVAGAGAPDAAEEAAGSPRAEAAPPPAERDAAGRRGARPSPGTPTALETGTTADEALVAEFADRGVEEGAGPEVRIEEPWEGYDRMRVKEVAERLRDATPETVAAVGLYERAHRRRRGVLAAADRALGHR